MDTMTREITEMLALLPESEQNLAYELVKRLVVVWNPDFNKLSHKRSERRSGESIEYSDKLLLNTIERFCRLLDISVPKEYIEVSQRNITEIDFFKNFEGSDKLTRKAKKRRISIENYSKLKKRADLFKKTLL